MWVGSKMLGKDIEGREEEGDTWKAVGEEKNVKSMIKKEGEKRNEDIGC